jgi:hypothetical protein
LGNLGRGLALNYAVFVRRLIEKGAVSPETAMTFKELDIDLGVHSYIFEHLDSMLLFGELGKVGKDRFYLKKPEKSLKKTEQLLNCISNKFLHKAQDA